MVFVSYGGGVNSTSLLIECFNRKLKIDYITFADTGAETPATYRFIKYFNEWLIEHNMPQITILKKGGRAETLEEECIRTNTLPSRTYGFGKCSLKYKAEPQEKFLRAKVKKNKRANIIKVIGYDADEWCRAERAAPYDKERPYKTWYPLIEWNIGRDECLEIIEAAKLRLPPKSSCFFCPSMKASEIRDLKFQFPKLYERALFLEDNAKNNLTSIKGLGRSWSWKDYDTQQFFPFIEQCSYCLD